MPLIPDNRNLRLVQNDATIRENDDPVEIINADESADKEQPDANGNVLTIEHSDGSITVSLDGKDLSGKGSNSANRKWFDNLANDIPEGELTSIAEELLKGIEEDLESRREWIEDRTKGIQLLGLKIETPGLQGSADGAPVEGMSRVRHPLLLEAVLRFQANARSELLPTDGPVKIRNDDNNSDLQEDQEANALQRDMNHYLTSTAKEYYPDTDRMLLMLGFGGTAFKKIYFDPLKNRPMSVSVDADDLIVNNSATDLSNASRKTHRVYMKPSTVKRLQILDVYRDIDLGTPQQVTLDAVQQAKADQQGINKTNNTDPENRDREIYECYCELDLPGYEHKKNGKPTGLQIPYRVTIDKSSRQVLSIVRNYDKETEDLPEERRVFVKYPFVPGLGFYDIGLLHILGNTTNAVTAAWREMLDAGMFANFPGFLLSDAGGRQQTNIFRIPPGGGQLVKTNQMPIRDAIMPLPYKEPSQALMALVNNMAETGMRVGGTSEQQVGEGRADAPVGTTLAMIDQATKILNSVHKRLHAAQAEEFALLIQCFKENPESFWQANRKAAKFWDQERFLKACEDFDLVPQADPNTASQTQRMAKVAGLKQISMNNPLYDPIAVDTACLQAMGWSNPSQFFAPATAMGKPSPEAQAKMAELSLKDKELGLKNQELQAKLATEQQKNEVNAMTAGQKMQLENRKLDIATAETEIKKGLAMAQIGTAEEDANLQRDKLQTEERIQMIDLAQNIAVHPESEDEIKKLLGNIIPAINGEQ